MPLPSGAVVAVACRDLMFRSKIETTLRVMGMEAQAVRPADEPGAVLAAIRPAAVIVDLALAEQRWRAIVAAARAINPPLPVLAFGPHVERDAQQAAHDAGCTLVVANSRLARELPALVERLLTPTHTTP